MSKTIIFILSVIFAAEMLFRINGRADAYTEEEIKTAEERVVSSPVYAEIKKGASLCTDACEGSAVKNLSKSTSAEILRDFGLEWYCIKTDNETYWTRAQSLSIPPDPETAADRLSKREIECYINTHGFKSKTKYLLWADIYRQQLYLLEGAEGSFRLKKRMDCSTGKNISPTTRGLFETGDKGERFYSERLKSGAKYWIRFNGSYLLHSVAMDKSGSITDPTTGKRASSGCIRTALPDAELLYNTIPPSSTIWVN